MELPKTPPGAIPGLNTLYSKWGESKIRELATKFYEKISNSEIKGMFPNDLTHPIEKQADFLIQVVGGPSLYNQKHGHPKMRMRHFAFPIDIHARNIWLRCYEDALQEMDFLPEDKEIFYQFLDSFSLWMVNLVEESK
jgi:hemoglobin